MGDKKYYRYQDYFKSFLGGWSFEDGDRTLTIASYGEEEMFDRDSGGKKRGMCVRFREESLPMVLNVTNAETIARVVGSDRMDDWVGRKVIVGQTKVRAFGKEALAIRVRDRKPDETTYKCESCGAVIAAYAGKEPSELAAISRRATGRVLCVPCQRKAKERMGREAAGDPAEAPSEAPGSTDGPGTGNSPSETEKARTGANKGVSGASKEQV